MRDLEEFLAFSANSPDNAGEIEEWSVWLLRVYASVAAEFAFLTEQVTRGAQRTNLYADEPENMLKLGMAHLTG